jgi:beta-N-acetylhexosaminidase
VGGSTVGAAWRAKRLGGTDRARAGGALALATLLLAGCVTTAAPSPASTAEHRGLAAVSLADETTRSVVHPSPAPTRPVSAPQRAAAPTTQPAPAQGGHPGTPAVEPAGFRATGAAGSPSLARLVGQKLVVAMEGTTPRAALLERIRRGRVGGVILFGSNISSRTQVKALTASLRAAAAAGGQPPLLIATDQEGGSVKRVPWAPPTLSPPEMGAIGLTSTARDQGVATGEALLRLGINCDFAPVADVPRSTASFMYQQGRTWSFSAGETARLSDAFARGLRSAGVAPAMKHFPGIGRATLNTDQFVVTIGASRAGLTGELEPYRLAVEHHLPMIMLSNVTYEAYDPANAAGWSRAIVKSLLRDELGFEGVTITDSLSGTAGARGVRARELAVRAAIAGTDMILLTGSEDATTKAFDRLLAEAREGTIPRTRLQSSFGRILALKAGF